MVRPWNGRSNKPGPGCRARTNRHDVRKREFGDSRRRCRVVEQNNSTETHCFALKHFTPNSPENFASCLNTPRQFEPDRDLHKVRVR